MFHSASGYPEMTSVSAGQTTGSYHQTPNSVNSPVYVPSSRVMPHSQYGHGAHFGSAAGQNGWPTDSFGSTHSQLPPQFYAQNAVMMSSWRAYDPSGFQRTSPYGLWFLHKKCIISLITFVTCR